jgi:hypothetical protein
MSLKRRALIISGVALGVVLAAGGYSLGAAKAAPVDTACVTSRNVPSHLYGSTHSCPRGQHKLQWDQRGTPSTAGPSGLDEIMVKGTEPSGPSWSLATCPKSHPYLLSGGGSWTNIEPNGYSSAISEPVPPGSNGLSTTTWSWQVAVNGTNASTQAYAVCAK